MTLHESIQQEIDQLRAKAAELEAKLSAIPFEAHALEVEVWEKIKHFFGVA